MGDGWFEVGLAKYREYYLVRPQGRVADRLFSLALADNIVWRWNGPPNADSFAATLQHPGSDHLAILHSDGTVVGHAGLYGHNPTHRTAFFEASLLRTGHGFRGRGIGAVVMAMWFLLNRHDLRKIYLETTDARAVQFSSLIRREIFRIEGRLTDHVFAAGRYQDAIILGTTGDEARLYLDSHWASQFEVKEVSQPRGAAETVRSGPRYPHGSVR